GEYAAGGAFHGFLDSGGSLTAVEYPGALETSAHRINDYGQLVGNLVNGRNSQGFLDAGRLFTAINAPGAVASCPLLTLSCGTFATGINNSGQIVGYFGDTAGVTHGFVYSGGGSFTTIDYPGISCPGGRCGTFVNGINDSGQIVGTIRFQVACGVQCLMEVD